MGRVAITVLLLALSGNGNSDYIAAPLQHADWQASQSKTLCQLLQNIDHFGTAGFLHYAGEPLQFFFQGAQFQSAISRASLFVEPAPWRDDLVYRQDYQVFLDDASASGGERLVVFAETAEQALNSLRQGHYPVFSFIRNSRETRVAVSSVNFSTSYGRFADCRNKLLPFGERQLEQGSLFFSARSAALSAQVLDRLRRISAYLGEVPSAKVAIVSATSVAGKADRQWFHSRAERIVTQLQRFGVAKNRINIDNGSHRPARDNELLLKVFGPDALRFYYFGKGNTKLNFQVRRRLDLLARYIQENYPVGKVLIGSHTDSKGSRGSNLKISQQRGDAVKAYLAGQGVEPDRILVKAYGESKPAKSNRFPTGRTQNRRVVISFAN